MAIKEIPKHLRPREKAKMLGVENLSDIELLALFLRSGSKTYDVLDVAKRAISRYGSFSFLGLATIKDLCKIEGIGQVKALEIKAVFELARRLGVSNSIKLETNKEACHFAHKLIGRSKNEKFLIVIINSYKEVINYEILYSGAEDHIQINPKDIISYILKCDAKKFYCFHNHPSGDARPSESDILMTDRLNYYASLFNVKLIGHFVINSKADYFEVKSRLFENV